LLFQACISAAKSKKESVFICKDSFTRLPYFVHNMPRADQENLNLIRFKFLSYELFTVIQSKLNSLIILNRYFQNSEELIGYLAQIHMEQNLPSIIAIDNLQNYIDFSKHEQVIHITSFKNNLNNIILDICL